jgi:hypothetical protein
MSLFRPQGALRKKSGFSDLSIGMGGLRDHEFAHRTTN